MHTRFFFSFALFMTNVLYNVIMSETFSVCLLACYCCLHNSVTVILFFQSVYWVADLKVRFLHDGVNSLYDLLLQVVTDLLVVVQLICIYLSNSTKFMEVERRSPVCILRDFSDIKLCKLPHLLQVTADQQERLLRHVLRRSLKSYWSSMRQQFFI